MTRKKILLKAGANQACFKYIIIVIFIGLIHNFCLAQSKRASQWYFGFNNLLSFNSNNTDPVLKTEGEVYQFYGYTSMADTAGNILFYSDGNTVWNKQHGIMKNGTGLKGNKYLGEHVLIIPFVNNPNKYYIFTSDVNSIAPCYAITYTPYMYDSLLTYSVVDMQQGNGNGAIIEKNTPLLAPVNGCLAVTKHANNRDYWLITQKAGTKAFYSYLINACGIQKPFVSQVETADVSCKFVGNPSSIKIAPNGKHILYFLSVDSGKLNTPIYLSQYLLNFDNTNGNVSVNTMLEYQTTGSYGFSFTNDSRYLFTSMWVKEQLYRYDLHATNIVASKDSIPFNFSKCLQLGIDGKIYSISDNSKNISIIENKPAMKDVEISLYPKESNIGKKNYTENGQLTHVYGRPYTFPNLMESYFDPNYKEYAYKKPSIDASARVCRGSSGLFKVNKTGEYESTSWYIEGLGWSKRDSIDAVFTSKLSIPGTYQIKAALSSECYVDTLVSQVIVDDNAILYIGDSIITCNDTPIELNAGSGYVSYHWQDGSNKQYYSATESGIYTVSATNTCGTKRDSVTIKKVQLDIPNIITPNNDGLNEVLQIKSQLPNQINLNIVNRWGSEVFNSTNYQNNWDANGLSDGIYYYTSNYEGCEAVNGWVQVVR